MVTRLKVYNKPSACKEWWSFKPQQILHHYLWVKKESGDQKESTFANLAAIFEDHLFTWLEEQ